MAPLLILLNNPRVVINPPFPEYWTLKLALLSGAISLGIVYALNQAELSDELHWRIYWLSFGALIGLVLVVAQKYWLPIEPPPLR